MLGHQPAHDDVLRANGVDVVTIDPLLLNVYGGDVADLIGRRGENLRSLQFVLGLMLNKQLRRHTRVNVDADGYRARREELLTGMAERFAARVNRAEELASVDGRAFADLSLEEKDRYFDAAKEELRFG